jgi:hypothetical protein
VEDLNDPQTLNRYAYVRNNPFIYTDPLGLWRISLSLHAGFGGHISYDSKKGHFSAGLGVGRGGGFSVGNNNWDIGYSDDNYIDVGYDNKMQTVYIQAYASNGLRGPGGEMNGGGISGKYYFDQGEYVVNGGAGIAGIGVSGGYSSFGDGSYNVGGNAYQVGANYDLGSKNWNYSYTVNPKELQKSYEKEKAERQRNGYGPEGMEKQFKVIDWLGTVMAGSRASERHDEGYRNSNTNKMKTDLKLLTDMAHGAISNFREPNGLFRTTVGLAISPLYYGAVVIGGGPAYRASQRNPIGK